MVPKIHEVLEKIWNEDPHSIIFLQYQNQATLSASFELLPQEQPVVLLTERSKNPHGVQNNISIQELDSFSITPFNLQLSASRILISQSFITLIHIDGLFKNKGHPLSELKDLLNALKRHSHKIVLLSEKKISGRNRNILNYLLDYKVELMEEDKAIFIRSKNHPIPHFQNWQVFSGQSLPL